MKRLPRAAIWIAGLLLVAVGRAESAEEPTGRLDPDRHNEPSSTQVGGVAYHEVERVLNSRCVVCHSCYDAPCQLKLTAWEGIARGASAERVYDGTRLSPAEPSRLFEDAFTASAWRARGFHPVLCERHDQDMVEGSALAQMLLLKHRYPNPDAKLLPDTFDLSIDRRQQCTTIENFQRFARDYPLWGMPFGLPELAAPDRDLLLRWIGEGAPRRPDLPRPELDRQIAGWERWLNEDTPKRRLAARYLYEHLFLAHLHFGDDLNYFRLVRSRTAPGRPVDLIATRRPFDDPGLARPYYRIVPLGEAVVSKTHMPYRLDETRLKSWQRWFVEPPFTVDSVAGYGPEVAANPFVAFAELPVQSRYRFLLDEAQFSIMNFIKGPVCRGQLALDVIDDYFWVFFADPSAIDEREQERFLAANSANLRLPGELESDAPVLRHWRIYAEGQKHYLVARAAFLQGPGHRVLPKGTRLIWDGSNEDGSRNPNAAVTVFRHFDSASVEQGLIGEQPQTAWIISYPLLERLHYLLVAGYDVYGNLGHQLRSRLYMDFLRIEGEQNFLSLLPQNAHLALENRWYRKAPKPTLDYVAESRLYLGDRSEPGLAGLPPQQAYQRLLERLQERASGALSHRFDLRGLPAAAPRDALKALADIRGASLQWLPQVVLIKLLPQHGDPIWLTLLNNSAHTNVAEIFFEDRRRLPEEDTLTLVNGVLGAYPNAFWIVAEAELPELVRRVATLGGETGYAALMDQFGMRRTNPGFWDLSDEVHLAMKKRNPVEFGLLDYNRLENR